ncbi:MAG: zinc metalloprotease HtpX [Candidatus Babeliaceae bacterium]|nr:zinc metalloprotease HtpX [Candidatus Babeliaceae bacterium]
MILNRFKAVVLLAGMSGLLLFMGDLLGGTQGLTIALIISIILNGSMYFFSDKIVLGMYQAQSLSEYEYSWIYGIVSELSHEMRLPMPKLWLIKTPMANAFATGRNPSYSSIALTTGIISLLTPDELRGVLAHELSHIKNRDILVTTIAATMAMAIGYCADFLRHRAFWGSFSNNSEKNNHSSSVLGAVALAMLMPLIALLIKLGISRSREYLADETGAHACRDSLALARALEKLHNHIPKAYMDPQDTVRASMASLFIVRPLRGGGLMELFSTHPSMQKRIEKLFTIHQQKGY